MVVRHTAKSDEPQRTPKVRLWAVEKTGPFKKKSEPIRGTQLKINSLSPQRMAGKTKLCHILCFKNETFCVAVSGEESVTRLSMGKLFG